MPVRVPLRIGALKGGTPPFPELLTSGLVNTGFEATRAECSLPAEAARRLGLWPDLPLDTVPMQVDTYGGGVLVFAIPDALMVSVEVSDRTTPRVTAWAVITTTDDEVVMSDALAESLGIAPIKPRRGLWIFADEDMGRPRPSMPPEFW